VHPLREVFVENEAKDVVAEFIRTHLPTEGVGDVPELGLKGFLVVVWHVMDEGKREWTSHLILR
jgi:hypothetical protein